MKHIAVVGAGISGISAAYLLKDTYNVTLFESGNYFGGHTHTIDLTVGEQTFPVDTGFIVFNHRTYPNLIAFFQHLGVDAYKSNMSFGVSVRGGDVEYCGSSIDQFFAQKKNLLRPRFLRMGVDVLRFNANASKMDLDTLGDISLDTFINRLGLSDGFKQDYLYPMAGAVWSTPTSNIGDYPARPFIQFFRNHGLLTITNAPQWYTVKNGSRSYVEKALSTEKIKKMKDCAVEEVRRKKDGVEIKTKAGEEFSFDQIILATPAEKTCQIIKDLDPTEKKILSAFRYSKNTAYLHSDESLMPKSRKAWASWNYFDTSAKTVGVTYWMNKLQDLPTDRHVFVTLNPDQPPAPELTYRTLHYDHPMFDAAAIQAQAEVSGIQGQNRTWYCGSYQRYGFHEDGIWSALRVVNQLGVQAPWQ